MHPYRKFIHSEMDARGWKPADLARRSGLSRQTLSKILNDDRARLGQMPDDSTIDKLAAAFGIPAERVRKVAAQSLIGYIEPAEFSDPLESFSTDYLWSEIRRRMNSDLS